MKLFAPPKTEFENQFDVERFNLSWNVALLVLLVFISLSSYYVATSNPTMIPTLMGMLVMGSAIISMKVTKSFIIAAYIVSIFGSLANQYNIFFVTNAQIMADLLWLISLCLYVFYALGSKVGAWVMAINLIGATASTFLVSNDKLKDVLMERDFADQIDTAINFLIAGAISIFLIVKLLKSSRKAEQDSVVVQKELIAQNEIVKAQNEEKTVMLKEIHHRVKNNLQVITSLLRLQSREIKDVATAEQFREAVNRVLAMALIHDKLYKSRDLAKVDIKSYLSELTNDLIQSYSTEIPVKVTVETNVEVLVPRSLVSVALLYNELISNSLKHGFKNVDEGEISIRINLKNKDTIEMFYSDNGEWKNPTKESSFGLELIDTLATQLVGTYELNTENGTNYHFTFEIEK